MVTVVVAVLLDSVQRKKKADAQLDMISNEPDSSLNCANMTLLRHMQEDMRGGEQTERGCHSC